jgi:3-hydroxyacyl-CoA dehydrogenase/enoyl-CoA hydratase/3-hydroxybutyryl-CoA epimerase
MTTAIKLERGSDGIGIVTMDLPGRSTNVLNDDLMLPFAEVLQQFETDATFKGLVITSAKRDFMVGADIDRLAKVKTPEEAYELAQAFKTFLRRLEKSGKPVVAALNGTALGGGLELALGAHRRIALNNPSLKIGLPEVKLGLLPGGGGTQRLPRLIGIQESFSLLLEGKELRLDKAVALGLIHELAETPAELIEKARAWCLANPSPKQPWDQQGFRFPKGDSRSPGVAQMLAIAPSMANAKAWGNYPAINHIMSSVFEGGLTDIDNALQIESRYFAACAMTQESRNMIGTLWYQLNAIKKGRSRPEGQPDSSVKKVGVLGAGMMGAGIAYVSAKVGIEVVLLDTTQEAAEKGKGYSQGLLDKAVARGRSTAAKRDELLARIQPTTKYEDLAGCDLIVEAVFEDRDVKAGVTKAAEAVIGSDAVFASNTSTLPITGLAKSSVRPAQFIGLHFFSPVDKMPLVEIIVGAETSPQTLARGFDYVQQIGKTPIVVNDSRGFYTSRVFATYIMEGAAMLAEGVHPRSIEVAGQQAGMPMPPLALQDEVTLSLGVHIADAARRDYAAEGKTYVAHPGEAVIRTLVKDHDRIGKKTGRGFYDYNGKEKSLWPGLAEVYPRQPVQPQQQHIIDRLMYVQANEAARCFEEGVLRSAADANIGSIFGWGFAPFQGGALQFINAVGLKQFVERSFELSKLHGKRFEPAAILLKMAEKGETFEDR